MMKDIALKLNRLAQLKKMGQLNSVTANLLLLNPKKASELIEQAYSVYELFAPPFPDPDIPVDGEILFANTKNSPVGFDINDLQQGLLIGSPGSGKSILTYHIALQAMGQGATCWMFVKGNDAEKLIRFKNDILIDDFNGQIPKNFLPPPPNYSRDNWNSIHWDIFIQANTLYDGTKNFLTNHYFDLYEIYQKHSVEPSFFEVFDYLKARKFANYSRDARYNESALNRLSGLLKGVLRKDLDCSGSYHLDLVGQNVIFNYKGLSAEASVYFINILIAWLAAYKEANGPANQTHLIILDDAMFVFDANRLDRRPDMGIGYINHILFETRKYKIKFLVDIQIPSLISKGILGTSNFKCLLNIPNANEVNFVLDILGVTNKDQREYAQKLDSFKREILVKLPSFPEPFLATIPESPLACEMDLINLSQNEKTENNNRILQNFSSFQPRVSYREIIRLNFESTKPNSTTSENHPSSKDKDKIDIKTSDFLMAVHLNQYNATLTEIYKLGNLTAGTGSRISKQCEKNGLIEIVKPSFGRGCPRYPVLLEKAYKKLGIKEKKFYGKGAGKEHLLYQHLIANHFSKLKPVIELNRNGKFIDVGIINNGKLIAVEVAMTPANEKVNIEKDIMLTKASFVAVACRNEKVLEAVEKSIAGLDLGLLSRVRVCLIGDLLKLESDKFVENFCNLNLADG